MGVIYVYIGGYVYAIQGSMIGVILEGVTRSLACRWTSAQPELGTICRECFWVWNPLTGAS